MRISGRKNLVIDSPKAQKSIQIAKQHRQSIGNVYEKAKIKKCYTLLDNYTGQIFQSQQKPTVNRFTSINYIPLQKNHRLKDLQLPFHQSSSQASIKNSRNTSRKLLFTPKYKKVQQKKINPQQKIRNSLRDVGQQLKKFIQYLKQYISQITTNIKQFMEYFTVNFIKRLEEYKNQNQKQINSQNISMSSDFMDRSFNIEIQAFKVQKILDKYQKLNQRMEQLPSLNLSLIQNKCPSQINQRIKKQKYIFDRQKKQPVKIEKDVMSNRAHQRQFDQKTQDLKFTERKRTLHQAKTQRFQLKKQQIVSLRGHRKDFSTFNQTLSKIKRLTFQGSILKL